jgi:ribosomal peptide maturation radical SAM protein 1
MVAFHPVDDPSLAPVDVCFVAMPYAHIARPSLALGILKSCLKQDGISCAVEYANLRFVEAVGLEVSSVMSCVRPDSLIGERTFAEAAFRNGRNTLNEIILGRGRIHQPRNLRRPCLDGTEFSRVFVQLRAFASEFVEDIALRVLARRPRIVGCSSTFEQHCPALAVLRRIKEIAPEVITMIGGANCEGVMGWATLRAAPWLDFVVSGEADELIAPLCRGLLERGTEFPVKSLPAGVLARAHVEMGREKAFPDGVIPRAILLNLNISPVPDFEDYFTALEISPLRPFITPALAVESSRGCWWGQKSHCTFCGLNGAGMRYRSKTADRVLSEWIALGQTYPTRRIAVADNIIDMGHVKTLLPQLAALGRPFDLFYETKANLRREQVKLFAEAGITLIQPGIEALHDDLLKLMAKGNSTIINIQLLKYVREAGIRAAWMLLIGFPGEQDAWHDQVAGWLPLIFHLQPPNGVVQIRYDRFSVYFNEPEKYGLDLRPAPDYAAVYPLPPEDLRDIAYFFRDANSPRDGIIKPGVLALGEQVRRWRAAFFRSIPPVFCLSDREGALDFFDTRPCAPARRVKIDGLAREIYLACDPATTEAAIIKRFSSQGQGSAAPLTISALLHDLTERKLLLPVHGKFLALACFGDVPDLCELADSPEGYVEVFDSRNPASAVQALDRLKSDDFQLRPFRDRSVSQ